MKGGIQAGFLKYLEASGCHISVYLLFCKIPHGMLTLSERSTEEQIELPSHTIFAREHCKVMREAKPHERFSDADEVSQVAGT